MSEYDLLKGLSELDEDFIMQPRKLVSLRMNLLFCFIAANISRIIPRSRPLLSIAVYFASFAAMFFFATWYLNQKEKRKLLTEKENAQLKS